MGIIKQVNFDYVAKKVNFDLQVRVIIPIFSRGFTCVTLKYLREIGGINESESVGYFVYR